MKLSDAQMSQLDAASAQLGGDTTVFTNQGLNPEEQDNDAQLFNQKRSRRRGNGSPEKTQTPEER